MKQLLHKGAAWFALGIGVWLVFWNPVDFLTQGLDHGIWDTSILTGGLLSIVVGFAIILYMIRYGKQHLF